MCKWTLRLPNTSLLPRRASSWYQGKWCLPGWWLLFLSANPWQEEPRMPGWRPQLKVQWDFFCWVLCWKHSLFVNRDLKPTEPRGVQAGNTNSQRQSMGNMVFTGPFLLPFLGFQIYVLIEVTALPDGCWLHFCPESQQNEPTSRFHHILMD